MATVTIAPGDLTPFAPDISPEKAQAMIEDTLARAKRIAPCLAGDELSDDDAAAAKGILRRVILRWHSSGSGVVTQTQSTTGPYSTNTTVDQRERAMFWPTEIKELQDICQTVRKGGAFSIDLAQPQARGAYYVTLADGTTVNLYTRPDLWLEYGPPPGGHL